MRDQSKEIKAFILEHVTNNHSGIVRLAVEQFSTSATTVQRHIATLVKSGMLVKSGNTRSIKYYLKNDYERTKIYSITGTTAEDKIFEEFDDVFHKFHKNI